MGGVGGGVGRVSAVAVLGGYSAAGEGLPRVASAPHSCSRLAPVALITGGTPERLPGALKLARFREHTPASYPQH